MRAERLDSGLGSSNLEVLFDQYRKFMTDLATAGERPLVMHDYAAFLRWWSGLEAEDRHRFEEEYRRGYSALLKAAEDHLNATPQKTVSMR